jgi:hypothetical protein
MHGLVVDADWLGKPLLAEDYGLYVPQGHSNPFTVWAAIEWYTLGRSLREVGDEVGVLECNVRQWLDRIDFVRRPAPVCRKVLMGRKPPPQELVDMWAADYNDGWSVRQICERNDAKYGAVHRALSRHPNVQMRGRGGRQLRTA